VAKRLGKEVWEEVWDRPQYDVMNQIHFCRYTNSSAFLLFRQIDNSVYGQFREHVNGDR